MGTKREFFSNEYDSTGRRIKLSGKHRPENIQLKASQLATHKTPTNNIIKAISGDGYINADELVYIPGYWVAEEEKALNSELKVYGVNMAGHGSKKTIAEWMKTTKGKESIIETSELCNELVNTMVEAGWCNHISFKDKTPCGLNKSFTEFGELISEYDVTIISPENKNLVGCNTSLIKNDFTKKEYSEIQELMDNNTLISDNGWVIATSEAADIARSLPSDACVFADLYLD